MSIFRDEWKNPLFHLGNLTFNILNIDISEFPFDNNIPQFNYIIRNQFLSQKSVYIYSIKDLFSFFLALNFFSINYLFKTKFFI